MSTALQGLDLKVYLREKGDTDWLEFVCDIDKQLKLTNETTPIDTGCGRFYGVKPIVAAPTGNAMYDVEAGDAAVSWNDWANWQLNKTVLEMLIKNAAFTSDSGNAIAEGSVVHVFMTGKAVDSNLNGAVGDVTKFSWTFQPNGLPVLSGTSS